MTLPLFLYLLGWLCLAAILKFWPEPKKRGGELNSFDVITILILGGRKSKVTG